MDAADVEHAAVAVQGIIAAAEPLEGIVVGTVVALLHALKNHMGEETSQQLWLDDVIAAQKLKEPTV